MNIEAVTIFRTWVDVAEALKSDEERGRLYHAICRYALYGEEPQLDGALNAYFTLMRPSLDKSIRLRKAQEKSVEKRRLRNSQNDLQPDLQCNSQGDLQPDLQCNSQGDLQNDLQCNSQGDLQDDLQNDCTARVRLKTETKKRDPNGSPKETAVSFAALLPPHLNREPFLSKWHEWEEYRRKKRKPISTPALKQQIKLLSTLNIELACAAIDNSIRNDYQGIFKPRGTEAVALVTRKDHSGI